MADFSTDIVQFQTDGTYEYEFDDQGNLHFNSSSANFSQVYLALPLTNVVYNESKISQFYDPTFIEFIPATTASAITVSVDDLQAQLGVVEQENITLKSQLDDFIAQNQVTSAASDSQAVQQVILELRIALGQGRVASSFSTTFPYAPLTQYSSSAS
jgi:hypothetical protein